MMWKELKVGDKVKYRGFGSTILQEATITDMDREGKNGKATVDLDDNHWCYLYQIERII